MRRGMLKYNWKTAREDQPDEIEDLDRNFGVSNPGFPRP
jgi:hypothetical protein